MAIAMQFREGAALGVAAFFSVVFWLSAVLFVAIEALFDRSPLPSPSWLVPIANATILLFWLSACLATIACLWAFGTRRRFLVQLRRSIGSGTD